MTSNTLQALEEGAVANLIAMSLDGKERTVINEDLEIPTVNPPIHKDEHVPDCVKHEISDVLWFEEKMLVTGGPAGKGPDPPEPPPVDQDDSSQYTRYHPLSIPPHPKIACVKTHTLLVPCQYPTYQHLIVQYIIIPIPSIIHTSSEHTYTYTYTLLQHYG